MKPNNQPVVIWGHWEFCFYNLPPHEVKNNADMSHLENLVRPLMEKVYSHGAGSENHYATIRRIRAAYRSVFGTTQEARNNISLVTYSGPGLENLIHQGIWHSDFLYSSDENKRPQTAVLHSSTHLECQFSWTDGSGFRGQFSDSKPSLLYTGDISLNVARTAEIRRLLTDPRWEKIVVLQVPHHGSAESWQTGLAAHFGHKFSVFSSGVNHRYGHPRQEVLDDLADTERVRVNELTGAVFFGCAIWQQIEAPTLQADIEAVQQTC